MHRIIPLNEEQLNKLPQNITNKGNAVRFMANGQNINICSGWLARLHSNVIYHTVYYDRPKEFIDMAIKFLSENNPGIRIIAKS